MSVSLRLSALARTVVLATALLAPAALAGCTRPIDDGTYYLGESGSVPADALTAS